MVYEELLISFNETTPAVMVSRDGLKPLLNVLRKKDRKRGP